MIKKGEDEKKLKDVKWDVESPLYDSYELVSLANHIDRHMMLIPWRDNIDRSTVKKSRYGGGADHSFRDQKNSAINMILWRQPMKKKKKVNRLKSGFYKIFARFWFKE